MKTRTRRTAMAIGLTLLLILGLGLQPAAADERIAIGTASTGGTWYPLGGGVANMINKYIEGYYAAAHPSGASIENIRAIVKKQDALALSMPDTAFQAYRGLEAFEGKPVKELRGLLATYPIDIQFYTLAKSDIRTIKDLKGKKVAVGAPGSGTEAMARYVLNVYGLTYDDIDERFLSATETSEAIKDGNIDVGIVTLGTPAPTLMDLSSQRDIRFLDIEPDVAEAINKEFPAYFPTTIPAGTYTKQDKPHHTLSWMGLFVVHQDMSEQFAYDILRAVFDHKDELDKIHSQFKKITVENSVKGMSIPWHPGAEKFFKERGVLQ
ncbi:TAXI family TRAP transporter solute-binding subunit [Desulfatitalea alkaliphila]|uniref:TAXI family TRAP transporter solute-binding subunit n=1 Tax=Desulfatitalea alkaliphila TaxID=2929485 RepID=A0AA41R907_9BACT|nr:TAXI family TRAP transporter solute-binding subunit [Desulfatitalea alkaliphila]MCJ8501068.1 TAXI family TRAP transporter solute-binding subunit [Desulfatitalea alkaliphila]